MVSVVGKGTTKYLLAKVSITASFDVLLEIWSKWWTDKCPSIIILPHTISSLLGFFYYLKKYACATVDVPQ